MAATLSFSFVSPERELFSGEVDAVVLPGTEGVFEVRPNHAPLMATLSPGLLEVHQGGRVEKHFVRGGFADVSPNGLTVLAEKALGERELSGAVLQSERDAAKAVMEDASSDPDQALNARRALDALAKY